MLEKNNTMAIILTLSIATLLGAMNMTIFNVALPALMTYFDTDVTTIQWLSSGFMLAAGVITPVVGFLGGRFGYKRTLNIAAFLVLVLSIAGTFSWCIEALIVVRILYGLTAGMLMPLSMAMLYQSVPRNHQAKAAAIWGTANIVGGSLPAVLSGVIITYATWHVLLWIMVPLAMAVLICSIKFLPMHVVQNRNQLDMLGLALTSVGSFVLLFAFSSLTTWGFSAKFAYVTIFGALCLGAYVKISWGKETAMLNLSVLKYPRYVAALIADGMCIIAMYTINFVMPLFLQQGLGLSAALTGAIMLPCSFASILAMPVATAVLTKLGEKALVISGVVILLVGSLPFFRMDITIAIAIVTVGMCVRSFGLGFINLLSTNTSMAAVPPELSGHASALTNWLRQMIGALTISAASTIVGMRLLSEQAQSVAEVSAIYISSTSLLMVFSCCTFILIIPIALKYFRGKADMKN